MKANKLLTTLLFALLSVALFAQIPDYIPSEYSSQYEQLKTFAEQKRAEGYIVLDPIEQIPMTPFASTLNGGNYAYDFYQVEANRGKIEGNKQRKVAVVIFDTGGAYDHPALSSYVWNEKGMSFTGEPSKVDGHGHSTHVASCVAGTHPNNLKLGSASILGSDYLRLIPFKVLRNEGYGSSNIINEGGFYLANVLAPQLQAQGYFVIANFSLGSSSASTVFDPMLKALEDAGVLVFGASGNDGRQQISIPAKGKNIHAIGAIDQNGNVAGFSNKGAELYMGASGVRLFGAWKNGGYADLSGTSMASPTQASIAAIIAATSQATGRQISHYLRSNATPGTWNNSKGYGVTLLTELFKDNPGRYPDVGNGNPDTPNPDPGNPDPEPDPEPDPDPPSKSKREILIDVDVTYPITWKGLSGGKFRTTYMTFKTRVNSDLFAPDEYDKALEGNALFFQNRAFVIFDDDDFVDAAYWARHFYEMIMPKQGYDYEMIEVIAIDEGGRKIEVLRPRRKISNKIKLLFNRPISSMTF